MTTDRPLLDSPLGRRLLAAFLLVALCSVAVLSFAALVATDRGLASSHHDERQRLATRVAATAADAYARTGGWTGADLTPAATLADAAGARLVIHDANGAMVWPGRGMGTGVGGMHATETTGGAAIEAAVTVAGGQAGTVRLAYPGGSSGGRGVAWSWIAGATLAALAAALIVSGYVSRRLIRPLVSVARAAHRFAGGDHTARARLTAPGELGAVAHAFDTMADEVVRAETVRRRLAADVAHELRTPLAALRAGLEELRDGLHPADPSRLAALHDQSLRLARVVQDLAALSAAEAAALSLRPVDADLADIAHTALAAQRPHLDAAGLQVTADLDTPVPVRADPDRLHQAITNLLANAARYCRPGDQVRIDARADSGYAVLRVADTGPGIPADELPHAFDRLWRGRDAQRVAGSGIGLAVVRELVTAHGGTAEIDSPHAGGLAVTLRLPTHPQSHPFAVAQTTRKQR